MDRNENISKDEMKQWMAQLVNQNDGGTNEAFIKVFSEVKLTDYTLVRRVFGEVSEKSIEERLYLQELAERFQSPIPTVSKLAQSLQSKGLIYWEHDSNGTYIRLSENGLRAMERQQDILMRYVGHIVEKVGKEKMAQMLKTMSEFNRVLKNEADNLFD